MAQLKEQHDVTKPVKQGFAYIVRSNFKAVFRAYERVFDFIRQIFILEIHLDD